MLGLDPSILFAFRFLESSEEEKDPRVKPEGDVEFKGSCYLQSSFPRKRETSFGKQSEEEKDPRVKPEGDVEFMGSSYLQSSFPRKREPSF